MIHDQKRVVVDGSPYDRGMSDSWYHRRQRPHYFIGPSRYGAEVKEGLMTAAEIAEYHEGYAWNEQYGGKKEWD